MRQYVLICGGRFYNDLDKVTKVVMEIDRKYVVLTGGASGADDLAHRVARNAGYDTVVCPANWVRHGKGGGFKRNQFMADEFDVYRVIAFPGGNGTAHMVRIAGDMGIPVERIGDDKTD